MKTPILGSSYVARSVNAADNRMVNLFPEMIPEGGKEPAFLSRCPGFFPYQQASWPALAGPVRGLHVMVDPATQASVLLVISDVGNGLLSKSVSGGVLTLVGGPFITGQGAVTIADNGTQMFIATNGITTFDGFIYNIVTDTLVEITDADFPGARTVAYLDGFFVFNEPNSQKIWVTALLDGTSVDALHFASAEAAPDGVVAVAASHGELWVFGETTTEVWYNAGTSGFPFAPSQGASIEVGCAAADTVKKVDDTLFWLGKDPRGVGIVYRANGYTPQRISTHAIEWQIDKIMRDYGPASLSNTFAYTYRQDGHEFYVLSFPDANSGDGATFVYDVATGAWHERGEWDAVDQWFARDIGNCCVWYEGYPVIGTGNHSGSGGDGLYQLNPNYGGSTKWLRSWRALAPGMNNLKRTAQHSLQLDCEVGTRFDGVVVANPQVTLRWSDDGGHTWSNEHTKSMGASGAYGTRVKWDRLGMTMKLRDRVYEVSGTDAVPVFIMGAELLLSPTNA